MASNHEATMRVKALVLASAVPVALAFAPSGASAQRYYSSSCWNRYGERSCRYDAEERRLAREEAAIERAAARREAGRARAEALVDARWAREEAARARAEARWEAPRVRAEAQAARADAQRWARQDAARAREDARWERERERAEARAFRPRVYHGRWW
jgi:hypothetical protein